MSTFKIKGTPREFQGGHAAGDPKCEACDSHSCFGEFPQKCRCGGLVHSDGDDEDRETGSLFTMSECDVCKEGFDPVYGSQP